MESALAGGGANICLGLANEFGALYPGRAAYVFMLPPGGDAGDGPGLAVGALGRRAGSGQSGGVLWVGLVAVAPFSRGLVFYNSMLSRICVFTMRLLGPGGQKAFLQRMIANRGVSLRRVDAGTV